MAATVLPFRAGYRGGKTALQWHQLKTLSAATGRPIVCAKCARPHQAAPPLGKCGCGGYLFGIPAAGADPQLALELDFHGGEK